MEQIPDASKHPISVICESRRYDYHKGIDYESHKYFGVKREKDGSYIFRTWAPYAEAVSLCSDVTDWQDGFPMQRITDEGVYECCIMPSQNAEGAKYKFKITGENGVHYKADPYAVYAETAPRNASIVRTTFNHTFSDECWMRSRGERLGDADCFYPYPLNIYEMHLGSFLRHADGSYASYTEIADKLVPYVRQMGYTHVEFLPVMEYPNDDSLGFYTSGFFSPTSRYGTPEEFAVLVDKLHLAGIGVIVDFVPTCFASDEHGLCQFSGSATFERDDAQSNGKLCFFDYNRPEVQSFLISGALYWLERFHIDGLVIDGGRNDPDTIRFLKKLTSVVTHKYPDVLLITRSPSAGIKRISQEPGRGFGFKWRPGWTKDIFDYVALDPMARMNHPLELAKVTAQRQERGHYILPISHLDISGANRSLIDRMQGSYDQKFAQMRALFLFQMTYPGKKLSFMGNEYGQFRAWSYETEMEWFMLGYDMHRRLQQYVSDLNHVYLTCSALYERDFAENGFKRLSVEGDLVAYNRYDKSGHEVVVLISFAGEDRNNFLLPVSGEYNRYTVLIDTADESYTARTTRRSRAYDAVTQNGKKYLPITVLSCSGILLKPDPSSRVK